LVINSQTGQREKKDIIWSKSVGVNNSKKARSDRISPDLDWVIFATIIVVIFDFCSASNIGQSPTY
jgi:hypothetical protein